jgi:hypothetical protein
MTFLVCNTALICHSCPLNKSGVNSNRNPVLVFFNRQSAIGNRQSIYPPSPLSSPRRVEDFFQSAISIRQSIYPPSPLSSPHRAEEFFSIGNLQTAIGNVVIESSKFPNFLIA